MYGRERRCFLRIRVGWRQLAFVRPLRNDCTAGCVVGSTSSTIGMELSVTFLLLVFPSVVRRSTRACGWSRPNSVHFENAFIYLLFVTKSIKRISVGRFCFRDLAGGRRRRRRRRRLVLFLQTIIRQKRGGWISHGLVYREDIRKLNPGHQASNAVEVRIKLPRRTQAESVCAMNGLRRRRTGMNDRSSCGKNLKYCK